MDGNAAAGINARGASRLNTTPLGSGTGMSAIGTDATRGRGN